MGSVSQILDISCTFHCLEGVGEGPRDISWYLTFAKVKVISRSNRGHLARSEGSQSHIFHKGLTYDVQIWYHLILARRAHKPGFRSPAPICVISTFMLKMAKFVLLRPCYTHGWLLAPEISLDMKCRDILDIFYVVIVQIKIDLICVISTFMPKMAKFVLLRPCYTHGWLLAPEISLDMKCRDIIDTFYVVIV